MSLIARLVDNWCFPPAYGHDPIHEKWVQLTLLLLVGNEGEMKSQVSDERWSWAAANRCAVHVVSVRLSSILDTPCTCMFDRVSCCCMLGNTGGMCCWDGWSQRELRVSAMAPGCPTVSRLRLSFWRFQKVLLISFIHDKGDTHNLHPVNVPALTHFQLQSFGNMFWNPLKW